LLARTFWYHAPGKVFIAGSAGIALLGCILALILLRREGQQQAKVAPLAPAIILAKAASSDEMTAKV
jgi:hypothetical protein